MKIVYITGNHPRHAAMARSLYETGHLELVIIEERESFMPSPPDYIDDSLKALFKKHFELRDQVESEFFGDLAWPDCELLQISLEELNGDKVQQALRRIDPDLLLTYGCHMLNESTLACCTKEKWNCHGGLSPWYRGAITHFWPSYNLEPQMTGMTVHELTQDLDAGDIVHQCVADLHRGDGLHALAARAVLKLIREMPILIDVLADKGSLEKKRHTTSGMLWLSSRWRAEHLKLIYEFYDDRVVDAYLDGKISHQDPKLYRQF